MSAAPGQRVRTIGRGGALGIAAASVVSGLAGYLVLVIVARSLDTAAYGDFLAFWGVLFFCYGVLTGVQSDVTRSVAAAHAAGARASATGARVLPLALLAAAGALLVAGVSAFAWGPHLFGDEWTLRLAALCCGVIPFAGHAALAGALGGRGAWNGYAALVAGESTMRLVLVVAVALAARSLEGFAVACAVASATWLSFVVVSPTARGAAVERADRGARATLGGWGAAAVAAASSASLIVGFPVLVRAMSSDATYADAAPLLLAVMLTRGPILVPLGAYQNVVVAHVVRRRAQGLGLDLRASGRALLAGVAVVALAALLGPWMLGVVRPGFDVSSPMFATLATSALLIAALTLTGAVTLAYDRHHAYALGWAVATVITASLLLLPGTLELRVAVCCLVGPVVGMAVHVAALRGATRAPARVGGATTSGSFER